ncbi:hypothetical protein GCM10010403_34970 [Glycomyces rutgersensis]|uniref:Uncharacterized protein n=1 Tax=Glycomyces rutgersensis TaxID=58115 RepID=A0ABP5SUY4_9ACTN
MADTIRSTISQSPEPSDPLVRGRFTDGRTEFAVRASSADAPDSFQVYVPGTRADIVLIVSGINSGVMHATWGEGWRGYASEWKVWLEDTAFRYFYRFARPSPHPKGGNDFREGASTRRPGGVRFCDG